MSTSLLAEATQPSVPAGASAVATDAPSSSASDTLASVEGVPLQPPTVAATSDDLIETENHAGVPSEASSKAAASPRAAAVATATATVGTVPTESAFIAPMTPPASAAQQSTDLEDMIYQVARAINMDLGAPGKPSQFRKKPAAKSFTKKPAAGRQTNERTQDSVSLSIDTEMKNRVSPIAAKRAIERAIKSTPRPDVASDGRKHKLAKAVGTKSKFDRPVKSVVSVPATLRTNLSSRAMNKLTAAKAKLDRPVVRNTTVPNSSPKRYSSAQRQSSARPKQTSAKARIKRSLGVNDPIWEGRPDELFPGGGEWPKGWVKRIYERMSGATSGQTDKYWYTPILQHKLRSMLEIQRWLQAMEMCHGDESRAREIYKNIVL